MPLSTQKLDILIIEDNPGDFVIIEDYLNEQMSIPSIEHATTLTQAKNILADKTTFDVVLLDLTLPDAQGEELVTEALKASGEIPVIVLTGYSSKNFSIKTLGLGVSDYLLKDDLSASQLSKSISYSIERKRINNELKNSEEKYRNLFYSSPTPAWVYDPETYHFLDVNAAACRHYGYSREEFLAMTIFDIRPEYEAKKVIEIIRNTRNSDLYFEGIFEHLKKNKELIHVNIQSNTISFSQKKARLVVANDITEKIKTELQIKESNDRYDLVSKATSDAIWDYKFALHKTYIAGTGYKQLFGYDLVNQYVNGFFWEDKLHPEDQEYVLNRVNNFIQDETQTQCQSEYRLKKSDGTYSYVSDRIFIIRENGEPVRIIGAINDITQRKEEEQRLKLLESIITNSNDAVMVTEASPLDEPGPRIIYVNDALLKMTGYEEREILGQSPRMFQGPKSDRTELDVLRNALENHQSCTTEIINYRKNGRAYWVNIDIAPVTDAKGNVSHMIAIEKDITNRKLQEQEREKLIFELIQNNKDLRQFSYITSHNLRGPIANLLGLTNLLDTFKINDPVLSKIMLGIKQAATNFDETIKDLSSVLNIKDRPSIPKEEIAVATVYNKITDQCIKLIEESKAHIVTDFSLAPSLNFNKAYLESIFLNLLTNAIKYRSRSTPLLINISTEEQDHEVVLRFKDNGRGMDLEMNKDKIFGLYQRFHQNTEGKGLGLFLVKSQMEALNGSIEVESTIGSGTLFTLRFKKKV